MKAISIRTPMNVSVQAKFASPGSRVLSFLIDLFIIFIYFRAIVFLFDRVLNYHFYDLGSEAYDINMFYGTLFTITLFPAFFYSLWTEMLFNGQTIGKMVTGIRVVKINGYKAGFSEYFTRWAFRLIDFWTGFFLILFMIPILGEITALVVGGVMLLASGLVALIFVAQTKNSQRLGDVVAGTTVLKLKEKHSIDSTILVEIEEDYVPRFPQVKLLTDKDARIIKDTFLIAKKKRDYATMRRLKRKLETVMDVQSDMRAQEFIETVMKDFNYYTQKL